MMKLLKYVLLFIICCPATAQIVVEKTTPQSTYASKILRGCLAANKAYNSVKIVLKTDKNLPKEAYNLTISKKDITIAGGDERGLIYGTLSLVEDIKNGILPTALKPKSEKAELPFRAIKYDLPWDTYRHSPALDLHYETCRDLKYWEKFLDMMVENRINALTLWNLHPYNYMIKSKNYPEACSFTDAEMKEWQDLFHGIFKMAEERGIDTYIFPFNIFVSPAFAKAHNVMLGNIEHNHISNSLPDTTSLVKNYTRDCIAQMLQEYPELDGMGITHGEMMGGMSPEEREDWLHATIIEGMRLAGRKTKLVHRIPLSADKTSGGSTSREAELITRHIIETEANLDFIEQPIWADMKFNWSHAHSTPKLIKVHGGKLYDGYFNPVPEKYKVTWTARNEDFFCLRWGVPDFVRTHITENHKAYMGGYFIGSETYIPAKDYFTKNFTPNTEGFNWQYAFERQWLFYKIWGRLMYNPQTPDAVFEADFIKKFGKNGKNLFQATALAGKTPLALASSFDCTWDFTLYSEGFLARNPKTNNVEYISVDRQITHAPLDPDYVSVKDFVQKNLDKKPFEKSKITPFIMAERLKNDCTQALELVKNIDVSRDKTLLYEVADVKIWSNLGLYFSEKTRGAIALQLYRKQGDEANKTLAIKHLEKALSYWDEVVKISQPIYNEMPLVHFTEQKNMSKEAINKLRFHWSILRKDVANDIDIAKNAVVEK
jgi:Glycosyl hydrolase family 20, domain 2